MIQMKGKQEIILKHFREGKNKSEIAKELEIDWKTVDKHVKSYRKSMEKLSSSAEKRELTDDLVKEPAYDSSNRKKRKITPEILAVIKECLEKNQEKKKNKQSKQQMKKIDIFEHLKELGHSIGYTTVATIINELNDKSKEAFIKQIYNKGDICEFDWGEAKLFIKGKLEKVYIAVFTAAYSNYRYSFLFKKHETMAFKQSHALFFEYIGKTFNTMVYDNDVVAVKRFVGKKKEPTKALLQLSIYYLFDYRFCNIRKGNEKGHVERSVEYVRRKAFCRTDNFNSLKDANEHLLNTLNNLNNKPLQQYEGKTPVQLLDEEYKEMRLSPPPFESAEISENRVDKYSTISVSQNRYSVPEKYVGKIITVRNYSDAIVCYYRGNKICEHEKTYKHHQWKIKLEHYLSTLKKKPGAVISSVAFNQANLKLKELHQDYFQDNAKEFIELLLYLKQHDYSLLDAEEAIFELKKTGNMEITLDKIRVIFEKAPQTENSELNSKDLITQAALLQLSKYDSFFIKEANS